MEADVVLDRRLDKQTLAPLLHKSDRPGLVHFVLHLGLFAASGAAVWFARPVWWLLAPALVAHGLVLVAFFAPLHEAIHRTAFRSRWLNAAVAWWGGLLLLLPPDYFRAFHFAHHAGTQDPARDPELASPKPATWPRYLWHVSGLPYWLYQGRILVSHAFGRVPEPFANERMRRKIASEARLLLALLVLLAGGSIALATPALLWLWVLPALLGQPFLRLYLLAEHWGCPQVPDMLANTRTTLTSGPVRFLAWNMPYHVEHHAYPAVPFHALPRLHGLIGSQAKVVAPGYGAFTRQVWRSLGR
jgi:fatty acid desaturase